MGSDSIDLEFFRFSITAPGLRCDTSLQLPLNAPLESIASQHPGFVGRFSDFGYAALMQMMLE